MKKFLLLVRGEERSEPMSREDSQAVVAKYSAWSQKLRDENRLVDSEGLNKERRHLRGEHEVTVSDRPFEESKEMIGGYFIFTAKDLEEATEIAKQCPAIAHGGSVELCAVMDY